MKSFPKRKLKDMTKMAQLWSLDNPYLFYAMTHYFSHGEFQRARNWEMGIRGQSDKLENLTKEQIIKSHIKNFEKEVLREQKDYDQEMKKSKATIPLLYHRNLEKIKVYNLILEKLKTLEVFNHGN